MRDFWFELSIWSRRTFGSDLDRGPIGPLLHLAKEVEEALVSPLDLEEYVDLLFLVFDATRRAGFSYHEFEIAVWKKLEKNKGRKWLEPSVDKPVEHIRD